MLPDSIPTVTVTGTYLAPNGRPLTGTITFRAPAVLTFPLADVILGGPVTGVLNTAGQLEVDGAPVVLPATDAPGMEPTGWSYTVTEQLVGVPSNRSYNIVLPAEKPEVDLADIAPRDPSKPNYVGVKGDPGPQGPPGSRIYNGTATPDPTLGVDGDIYVRYDAFTLLGVTSTTVSTWTRSAGTWTQRPGDIRGAAWYLNTGATPSTGTKPGDLLLRTDTGDLYQRSTSGWGSAVGNLRGPTGAAGANGATGSTGAAGAPGVVQSVNGKSQAAVVLAAADVGAIPTTAAGTAGGVAQLDAGGKVPAAQLPATGGAVASVNGQTGAVVLAAADVGAATTSHTHTATAVGALATTARGAANGVASLDASSKVPIAQLPAAIGRNVWTPQALGFQAWSVDPAHVANPTTPPKAAVIQRLYMSGINITEATQVNTVAIFARGWAGSTAVPAARFYAGVYNDAGSRVATSGLVSTLPAAGQISGTAPGAANNHMGAVPVPLTAPITLQPGRYWAAFLVSAGAATDFYYVHCQNEAPSAPANFFLGATAFQRAWCLNSQTSLPATVNQTVGEVGLDPAIMALAMV
ncbi:hypothetical protein [Streptomyces sp. NPDC002104]